MLGPVGSWQAVLWKVRTRTFGILQTVLDLPRPVRDLNRYFLSRVSESENTVLRPSWEGLCAVRDKTISMIDPNEEVHNINNLRII